LYSTGARESSKLQHHLNIGPCSDGLTASNPNMEAVQKVVEVAMQSVKPQGVYRPTMTKVIQELLAALAIEETNVPSTQTSKLTSHSSQPLRLSGYSSVLYGTP